MKIWQQLSDFFAKLPQKKQNKEPLLSKYQSFREFLSQNNFVLELMARIEEKMSAPGELDGNYLERNIRAVAEGVRKALDQMKLISQDMYPELNKKLREIDSEIEHFLAAGESAGGSSPVLEKTVIPTPPRFEGYRVLIDKGTIACQGIAFGKAYVLKAGENIETLPEGSVLVSKHTSAKYASVLGSVAAIITDIGGKTAHLSTLAREFRIPMIVDTEVATQVIADGRDITVDAINGIVYEGKVAELYERSEKGMAPDTTPDAEAFQKILRKIIPLNLVDPKSENFKPEFCKTLHDIMRFAHQKAMQEMFKTSGEFPQDAEATRLMTDIPLAVYVIDLGGGIESDPKAQTSDTVRSIPFKAFLKGLSSLAWPEPRHVDVKGFLGMVAHTASVPEEELEQTAEESFAFIAGEYMNFSIRLGYHLSVVEAYTGKNINDNYIRFFFKGGAADLDRRLRRVRLISGVLSRLDFDVRVTADVIDATITKYRRSHLEQKLEVLGKLTVYTKQMDAIMYDDAAASHYMEQFLREHINPDHPTDNSSRHRT